MLKAALEVAQNVPNESGPLIFLWQHWLEILSANQKMASNRLSQYLGISLTECFEIN